MDKKILIVEDDKSILDVLAYKIKEEGYKVFKAIDGQQGLNIALSKKPDLILLDLQLPKMSGQELLTNLRKDNFGRTIPVIILTNDQSTDSMEKTLNSAAPAYFIKAETNLATVVEAVSYHLK